MAPRTDTRHPAPVIPADPVSAFRAALADAGLSPPEHIEADGALHRFSSSGKHGDDAGWYVLHGDGIPAGVFGDWRTGLSETWRADIGRPLTPIEDSQHRARVDAMRRQREAERERRQTEAQARALDIWSAATPAPADHPYLLAKGVKAHGIRLHGEALVVPMRSGGELHSLQFIGPDGSKRFLSGGRVTGCYFSIGTIEKASALCICEGYATAASVHEATGYPAAITFNCGNLEPVARSLRERYSDLPIILCADDDHQTPGNPGLSKATEAAQAVGGLVAVPDFGPDRPEGASDFNDLFRLRGLEAVTQAVAAVLAKRPTIDPPIPLDDHAPQAISADTLPGWLGAMVGAVAQATETPPELATMAGLACVAAAVQRKVRIRVEPGYIEPLALWTVCALDPGNRKTAVMVAMSGPLYAWERTRAREMEAEIRAAETVAEAHSARLKRAKAKYAKGKVIELEAIRNELVDLETTAPEVPRPPRIVAQDVTPEHTGTLLAEHGERLALLSDEGGIFEILAGRYSRGIPNLDLFLQAHAGAPVRVDRGSRSPVHLAHPALTIGLSPQPEVLRGLASQPGFRGRGLLARFLYALPNSTLGYRTLAARPVPEAILSAYAEKLGRLLDLEPATDPDGEPAPYLLELAPAAHCEWKDFQRMVEVEMREGGRLEHITDWAAKLPGAVARVAGLLHCVEHAHGEPWRFPVSLDTMTRALTLGALLIEHARAVFDLMGSDTAMGAARKVWRWIERQQHRTFRARDCWQALRGTFPRRADIDPAFSILEERRHIFQFDHDRSGPGRPSLEYIVHSVLSEGWK